MTFERSLNTPDAGGYGLAVAVSIPCCSVLAWVVLVFPGLHGSEGWVGTLPLLALVAPIVAMVAIPIAALSLPVVHLMCRDEARQWVHVVVTAATAALCTVVAFAVLTGDVGAGGPLTFLALAVLSGVPAGIGRLAVVPLVVRRRQAEAEGAVAVA